MKNWAAVLKIVQLYEIIRMYDISRLDSNTSQQSLSLVYFMPPWAAYNAV